MLASRSGDSLDAAITMGLTPSRRTHWRPGMVAGALWAVAMLGLATLPWFAHLLRQAGRPELFGLNADAAPFVLAILSATTVGAVLASRRPRHPVGWLLLVLGLSVVASGVAQGYAGYGLLARPGALPAARYAALYDDASFIIWPASIGFVLLLTPTGSLPSTRWRWWARITAAAPVVFLLGEALRARPLDAPYQSVISPLAVRALTGPVEVAGYLAIILTQLAVVAGAASLVVRFRRARGVRRQQLRWVALAAALSFAAALVVVAGMVTATPALYIGAAAVDVALLPLTIGAAILRYRLYDLDRIISRTLAYGLLTVLLGGGYAGVVLGLGQLVGQDSTLLVAAATLAVAGVFQPARRRVQNLVDRRFNRRRYDAATTIEEFSVRLRQQVDLDSLTTELLAVVEQTMQPTQVSLWLRPTTAPQGAASTASGAARQRAQETRHQLEPGKPRAGGDVGALDGTWRG